MRLVLVVAAAALLAASAAADEAQVTVENDIVKIAGDDVHLHYQGGSASEPASEQRVERERERG